MQSIYVHIPFCQKKCEYCNFFSQGNSSIPYDQYVDSLIRELRLKAALVTAPIKTLYIGGGTPSIFPASFIKNIILEIESMFGFDNPEITLEVNPGTIDKAKVLEYAGSRINRISLGVQSFHDHELEMLGRVHTADQAIAAVQSFHQAGIDNLSIDLMFGLPFQKLSDFSQSIDIALGLPLKHISVYCLQLEPGTLLEEKVTQGALPMPDEDLQLEMYSSLRSKLCSSGYDHYEISNFSKPGNRSIHNSNYWNYHDFLGVGAGATSMVCGERYTSTLDILSYIADPAAPCFEKEQLSLETQVSEAMFLGLRQLGGIDLDILSARFSLDLATVYQEQLQSLLSQGLIEVSGKNIRLADEAIVISNEVFERFLI